MIIFPTKMNRVVNASVQQNKSIAIYHPVRSVNIFYILSQNSKMHVVNDIRKY
jgi:hypothetical protein